MARLLSLPVLAGGALLASPALWAALVDGTMPLEVGLTRLLVGVVAVWVGISLVGGLVQTTSAPAEGPRDPGGATPAVRGAVVDTGPQD